MADAKSVDGFLNHHGVKGMKWGVRNDRGHEGERAKTKDIAKADKKYVKSFSGSSGFLKMHNEMAGQMNQRLGGLNRKYEGKDLLDQNSKDTKSYFKEYENLVKQSAEAAMKTFGTNASGTGQVKLTKTGSGLDTWWQAEWEDLKHADGSPKIKVKPKFNNKGFIVSQTIDIDGDSLKQFEDMGVFLAHFGVKGMKWGVRRENHLNSLKRTKEGVGSLKDKYTAINSVSALDIVRGKGFQGALSLKISELEDRKARTVEGKRIAGDILSDLGLVGYANLGKKRK